MKRSIFFIMLMCGLLPSCHKKQNDDELTSATNQISEAPILAIEKSEVMDLLDQGDLSKAHAALLASSRVRQSVGLLLKDCSEVRFNANKIYYKDKTIILQGRFWIRSGDTLIDGRGSDDSYAVIHKKSMMLIELGGEYEQTILITKGNF